MEYSIDNSFGFLVSKVKSRMKNKIAKVLKPHGITPEQRGIVLILCKYGKMTQKAICDMADMEPANMAVTLKRLIANGFVEKIDHPSDSRAYLVNATQKSKNLEQELVSYGVQITKEMLNGISQKEQEETLRVLKKMFENLKRVEK